LAKCAADTYSKNMEKLQFGTDGIRGIYGQEITDESAYRLGKALGGKALIAGDTRASTPALLSALAGGIEDAGGCATYLGVATTPALYYTLLASDCNRAVMVTASHNPPSHNGLKVFDRTGKIGEEERRRLLSAMDAPSRLSRRTLTSDGTLLRRYEEFIARSCGRLDGVRAVVDFANGAGGVFCDLLASLGADVTPLNALGQGTKINVGCGAIHPETLRAETMRLGADLGFALDGDGDRIVAVTKSGDVLDGDAILYLFARKMKKEGRLKRNKVALTIMTNSGVLKSLSALGVTAVSCSVGDAAVTEAMRSEGLNLGGEQSGHIVLGDLLMTGDALLVGAMLMKMIRDGEKAERPAELTVYPQALLNVPVPDRSIAYSEQMQSFAARKKQELGAGRVLVRASGTENVVRIMAECPDATLAELTVREIKGKLLEMIGQKQN